MANSYTEKLKKRIIGPGDPNWDDEGHANEYINEVALAALMSTNRIEAGGVVADAGGLLVDVSAVTGRFAGDYFSLPEDTLGLSAALPGEEQLNWIYIDDTPQLQVSNVPPTGDYLPLALIDSDNAGVLRIADLRPLAQPVEGVVENDCINGTFDIWDYDTVQTSSGYGSDSRFSNEHSGSTKEHSRQVFTPGQISVPGNPKYFSRTVVTSVAGVANYVRKVHRVLDVTKYSGKRVAVVFHSAADAVKNIAVEGMQNFGSGGSVAVEGISAQLVELPVAWDKRVVFIDFPSVSGKTIGNQSYNQITFWFDAGSDFDSRTNGLGQQSGIFDLAEIKIHAGEKELPCRRPYEQETRDICTLYYEEGYSWQEFGVDTTRFIRQHVVFNKRKIRAPEVTLSDFDGNINRITETRNTSQTHNITPSHGVRNQTDKNFSVLHGAASNIDGIIFYWKANSEI
ncbi:hypothetical protein [Desulfopila inferna]|uniref:hypothetical protein n=1 Tax=Desulfopila inferna TaxID=468528 RepID=UPI001963C0FF|nr:hypothetical protein [Desulfopila inferna]MBM9605976.1 hypothetical protein [Desulfopila inferna]